MPGFRDVISQAAWNQSWSGTLLPWRVVPAVALVCLRHDRQTKARRSVRSSELSLPQRGQRKPSGQASRESVSARSVEARHHAAGRLVHTSPPPSRSGGRGWWSFSAVMLPPDAWILILAQLNPATRRGRVARRRVRPGGAASGLRPIGVKALATARRPVPCEFQGATRPDAMRSCPSNAITVDALSDASAVCGHASVPGDGCRSSVAARRRSRTAADRSAPPGVSFSFPDRKLQPSRGTTT